jgi:hypothetical protein
MKKPSLPSFDLSGRHSPIPLILLSAFLLIYFANIAFAQCAAANRVQWQPKLEGGYDTDRRLEQRVRIEIMGRSANSALKILSQRTKVNLATAPEDLSTVGERKLVIIVKGLSLKVIMLQLCEALQECHWDIATSGKKPAYFLHRNADADDNEHMEAQRLQERCINLGASLDEIRNALTMSPDELAELEKSDLFLGLACRGPEARSELEAVLSMSPRQMQTFLQKGTVYIPYLEASPQIQAMAKNAVQQHAESLGARELVSVGINPEDLATSKSNPETWIICYSNIFFINPDLQDRLTLLEVMGDIRGKRPSLAKSLAVPSYGWLSPFMLESLYHLPLLAVTNTQEKEATNNLQQFSKAAMQFYRDVSPGGRLHPQVEPTNPKLRVPITLKAKESQAFYFDQLEKILANQTGFSIISDYFTEQWSTLPKEAFQGLPLWRLLGRICFNRSYEWKDAGDCLIFHHTRWYEMRRRELPESVINACREKMRKNGSLKLNDMIQLVRTLSDEQLRFSHWPPDFHVSGLDRSKWALLLYDSLDAKQAQSARSEEGLPFKDLNPKQQQQVRARAVAFAPNIEGQRISDSRFFLQELPEAPSAGGNKLYILRFRLQLGDLTDYAEVMHNWLRPAPPEQRKSK